MTKNSKWMRGMWAMGIVLAMAGVAGCESTAIEDEGTVSLAELQGNTVSTGTGTTTTGTGTTTTGSDSGSTTTTGTTTTNGLWPAEMTGTVKFLHTDVSEWPVTASLNASVSGSTISIPYSKSKVWPARDGVNANPWVFANVGGQWYAATWEWLKFGQVSKPKAVLAGTMGDHIKVSPLSSWRPHSGERIGLMVSGLARTSARNVRERSNVVMVTWP